MFLLIEFWRIGQQIQKQQVLGKFNSLILVPTGTIDYYDDVFLRVAAAHFGDEELNAFSVDLGQNQ